jgi:hypothetical protein
MYNERERERLEYRFGGRRRGVEQREDRSAEGREAHPLD